MPLLPIVFLIAALVLGGCERSTSRSQRESVSRRAPGPPAPGPLPKVVLLRGNGAEPPHCSVPGVADGMNRFLSAFNRGDTRALSQLIADPTRFQWFSFNKTGSATSRHILATGERTDLADATGQDQRPALMRYFAARHRAGERMRLLEVSISRVPPRSWMSAIDEELAGVDYTIRLDSDDFNSLGGSNHLATGKGALACNDARVLMWATGLDAHKKPPLPAVDLCHATPKLWRRVAAPHPSRPVTIACR